MSSRAFEKLLLVCAILVAWKWWSTPVTVEPVAATGTVLDLFLQPNHVMIAWQRAEGADPACNNPLNTTLEYGTYTVINSHGVKCYAHPEEGLEANVRTLSHAEYAPLVNALEAEDGAAFVRAIAASRWGTDAGLVADILEEGRPRQLAVVSDNCSWNMAQVRTLIGNITLEPGELFSFNSKVGDPARLEIRDCGGVPGGGWCNVAAEIAREARKQGLDPIFTDHGLGDIGGGPENSVMIWNVGGQAGGDGDLTFINTTNRTIIITESDYE